MRRLKTHAQSIRTTLSRITTLQIYGVRRPVIQRIDRKVAEKTNNMQAVNGAVIAVVSLDMRLR